ncbi:MAG: Orn/DAP/Arg decarboxylase 2 [Nocardioidaceae bacterium]|nr:Orn/DAP/Arg decarboxylase 2 [Nocardioidaceae bacterium]
MEGIVPLTGRLAPWMADVLADHAVLDGLLAEHGSPVNLIEPGALGIHAAELVQAAASRGVDLRVYFARKANKTLALVDAALADGHGVDVASLGELEQVLRRLPVHNAPVDRVILSAAVKQHDLVDLAVRSGVLVSVDNADELALVQQVALAAHSRARVALRLRADVPGAAPSRFGLGAADIRRIAADPVSMEGLELVGLHFHLHGYAASHRARALEESLDLVDAVRADEHRPEFIDIGGGVPMSYLDEPTGWDEFWHRHRAGDAMTWRDRVLGTVYPAWQTPVRGAWLGKVLDHVSPRGALHERIAAAGLRLHLEPGRALLDGCGITVARVEFRKQQPDGTWLVGLAMNRTQCRSAADDFLVDPVLVTRPGAPRTPPGEGYLVGAYCIEDELLTWRRMRLPQGAAVGDLVVFVNTAGYQMHILESASHQIPLARNLVPAPGGGWQLDRIDR